MNVCKGIQGVQTPKKNKTWVLLNGSGYYKAKYSRSTSYENGYDTNSELYNFSLTFLGCEIQKLKLLNKETILKYFYHGKVFLVNIPTNSDILMERTSTW